MSLTLHRPGTTSRFVGRVAQLERLHSLLEQARRGKGQIALLAGEAGVGKTRLVEECLRDNSGILILRGAANENAAPYTPIVAALRTYLRRAPDGFAACGPLAGFLALLLPELGPAHNGGDRATLVEALGCAFREVAHRGATVVFLDDLHLADNATLELLPELAVALAGEPILIVAAYRSDEVPRDHPIRRLRYTLRRMNQPEEIVVEPLDPQATEALVVELLAYHPEPRLLRPVCDRSQGIPLFVEELVAALGQPELDRGGHNIGFGTGSELSMPETLRDAILFRLSSLSHEARTILDVAAVTGRDFALELVTEVASGEQGLEELLERRLLVEDGRGRTSFRQALVREAVYGQITRARRRALHRQVAARLQVRGAPAALIAEHWLAAHESGPARRALLVAARQSCDVHAYRDAVLAAQRALELWPESEDEPQRLEILDQLGRCAQLCGMFGEAVTAWREVADARRLGQDWQQYAQTERSLASLHEMQGNWERAMEARHAAAEAFAAGGLPAEAAAERLAQAAHLEFAGSYDAALALVKIALAEAEQSDRVDLKASALGLQGQILGALGQTQDGIESAQAGLALALEHNLIGPAADAYYRLADILDKGADYSAARQAFETAISYCEAQGAVAWEHICRACLAVVLVETGDWAQARSLCRNVLASPEALPVAKIVANGMLGMILAHSGQAVQARRLLLDALSQARGIDLATLQLWSLWGLAMVDVLEDAHDSAAERCHLLLERWEQTDERHYVIPVLRWAATFFATRQAGPQTRACAEALSRIAATTATPEALAALAHALGESAWLEGDARQAALHFTQALDLLRELDTPLERAETQLRAGLALAAAGERAAGVEQLASAYRIARKLGARPLAASIARAMADLGERVDLRLGRMAEGRLRSGDLTRRQVEILRLVALGRTNKEIAQELYISPRTVEMHVGDILASLDCRSRADAVRRAAELDLL